MHSNALKIIYIQLEILILVTAAGTIICQTVPALGDEASDYFERMFDRKQAEAYEAAKKIGDENLMQKADYSRYQKEKYGIDIDAMGRTETAEQIWEKRFESQRAEGYEAAKSIGDQRLMRLLAPSVDPEEIIRRQEADSARALSLIRANQIQNQLNAQRYFLEEKERLAKERRAHQAVLDSKTIVDVVDEYTSNCSFSNLDLAKNNQHPTDSNIKLDLPVDFWNFNNKDREAYRVARNKFFAAVRMQFLKATSSVAKNHWFFIAVGVSGKEKDLEKILRLYERKQFREDLVALYNRAGSPELNFYFNDSRADAIERQIRKYRYDPEQSVLEKTVIDTGRPQEETNSSSEQIVIDSFQDYEAMLADGFKELNSISAEYQQSNTDRISLDEQVNVVQDRLNKLVLAYKEAKNLVNRLETLVSDQSNDNIVYLKRDDRVVGPFNILSIEKWMRTKKINNTDHLSDSDNGPWITLSDSPLVKLAKD